ncbi:MAG: hypothetical protein ABI972_13975 [Acidobacteriota bacterium]
MYPRFAVTLALACALLLAACSTSSQEKAVVPRKNPPKILQFYASEGVVRPGSSVTICYGVEYAESVRIEPFIEEITPSHNRCIEAKPDKTTLYTMTAEGPDGKDEASFTITTDPRAKSNIAATVPTTLIQFLMASSTTVTKGRPVTICYGVKDAVSVSLSPKLRDIEPSDRNCFSASFDTTTTLTLTAKNSGGIVDTEKLTITVQ